MAQDSSDALKFVGVKVSSELEAQIGAVAQKSGQTNSAVVRAAIRLGLTALSDKPEMVKAIEGGMLEDPAWLELRALLSNLASRQEAGIAKIESAYASSSPESVARHMSEVELGRHRSWIEELIDKRIQDWWNALQAESSVVGQSVKKRKK